MASSRTTYTALTPEFADFAIPHTPVTVTSRLGPRGEAFEDESHDTLADDEQGDSGRIRAWLASAKATAKNNTGLLLIAASQAFFSLMNVAVKKLNGIDPPVSTLEVSAARFFFFESLQLMPLSLANLAHCSAHGVCSRYFLIFPFV
jgi:hypothetical protein